MNKEENAKQAIIDTTVAYDRAKERGFKSAAEKQALVDARWKAIERLKLLGGQN